MNMLHVNIIRNTNLKLIIQTKIKKYASSTSDGKKFGNGK